MVTAMVMTPTALITTISLDANEWLDTDSDGIGDNSDQYPYDPSQSVDSDGDGFGDNTNGTRGDAFPEDGSEWLDTDGDGVGDNSDDLPFNPSQTSDADGDGFAMTQLHRC